jgi:hypothetical protein
MEKSALNYDYQVISSKQEKSYRTDPDERKKSSRSDRRDPYVERAIERVKAKFRHSCSEFNGSGRDLK